MIYLRCTHKDHFHKHRRKFYYFRVQNNIIEEYSHFDHEWDLSGWKTIAAMEGWYYKVEQISYEDLVLELL